MAIRYYDFGMGELRKFADHWQRGLLGMVMIVLYGLTAFITTALCAGIVVLICEVFVANPGDFEQRWARLIWGAFLVLLAPPLLSEMADTVAQHWPRLPHRD